jgi:soluble lytic murein transglycosylase-like protein
LRREETIALLVLGAGLLILIEPTVENEVKKVIGAKREKTYDELIWAVAVNYNFDPDVLRAIVRVESTWNPTAVSLDGLDIGLAGIRYGKGPKVGTAELFIPEFKSLTDEQIKEKLFDPQINLDVAGRVIAELTAHGLGESPAIFHAYNVGETKYRNGTRSPFVERYVVAYNDYSEGVA